MDFDGAGVLHVFAVDNSSVNTAHRFLPTGQERGTVVLAYPFPMLGVSDILVQRAPRMVLPVIADSFIRHGAPNENEGANPRLRIREAGHNRVLVAFDLGHTPREHVGRATLVLTIAENGDNWGHAHNRSIDAHPLLTGFVEGNGNDDRGSGAGVTWFCAVDAQIGNHRPDCSPMWRGGRFGPATAAPVVHFNGLRGDVRWDVTADVLAGTTGWVLKKRHEGVSGKVGYYSREGAAALGSPLSGPRLIIELR
jgi:hypothetical protein